MSRRTPALWPGPGSVPVWPALQGATKAVLRLTLLALCITSGVSHASEQTSVTLDRPGAGITELKKGDNVPDEYQRPSLAVKDWKSRQLSAPGKNEQWVEINGKLALVSIPTGTIKQLIDKP